MALASVRTNGGPMIGGDWRATTAQDRAANLEWAIKTLRDQSTRRPQDPALQTDLGEALAKIPKYHPEAVKILGALAARDLVASAQGYAALARLRDAAGDKAGRDAAVKRCEGMSVDKAQCRVPGNA